MTSRDFAPSPSRRVFLGGGAALGILAASRRPAFAQGAEEAVPAVVVGSGFGGAVAALRLAQAGIPTVLLERGRRWRVSPAGDTFATAAKPDGRAAWLAVKTDRGVAVERYPGVLEARQEEGITVLAGAGLGGGSLVYRMLHLQPPQDLFYGSFPRGLDYAELDRVYYPRVKAMLQASAMPADVAGHAANKGAQVFLAEARASGLDLLENVFNADWTVIRQELQGLRKPSLTAGDWAYGTNSGAKGSLDRNYLALAEATGFLDVRTLHQVRDLAANGDDGYTLTVEVLDERGAVTGTRRLRAKSVFLAAGAMGTTALLVRAKATGGLPRLNEAVGEGFGANGDVLGARLSGKPNNPGQGGPAFTATVIDRGNPLGAQSVTGGPVPGLPDGGHSILAQALSPVRGRFAYDKNSDRVGLSWPGDPNAHARVKGAFAKLDAQAEAEGRKVEYKLAPSVTVHPLGGAVIGEATDLYGRVRGHQGLYVVDGALIPGATGCVAPAPTIAALAERVMDEILLKDLGRRKLVRVDEVPARSSLA